MEELKILTGKVLCQGQVVLRATEEGNSSRARRACTAGMQRQNLGQKMSFYK
jgi:hypothetical protein